MRIEHIADRVLVTLDNFLRAVLDTTDFCHEVRILNVNISKQNKLIEKQLEAQAKLLQELIYIADKRESK